ncbi:MAG TPA: glycerate dehydrogenase, partial [Proteobacteria bacterium]|nr:glycerate dehydrogenase [Pseudomonadota bacterium]
DLPNLLLTPHTAWASRAARQRLINEIGANVAAFLGGTRRNRVV